MNKELINYFNGDELAASAWLSKYALEGETTPNDMHKRMAKEIARIENKYIDSESETFNLSKYGQERKFLTENRIYNLFKDFKYIIPQGSIMSGLGNPKAVSLSNCFVIDSPHDSYGGIFKIEQEMVQLMKRRGGVGIELGTLRPSGTVTNNAAKTSTGMASFMERYSNGTREVAQDGRRGALMLSTDIRHPDSLAFINAKKDRTKVTGANISVKLWDDFMEAVKKDEDYILRFPCKFEGTNFKKDFSKFEYNKLYTLEGIGEIKHYIKKVKAKELYDSIVENAWENAEPGQLFWDRVLDYSPDGIYEQFKAICTNPCGEIPMQPYDACRLLALNFFSFVNNPFTDKAEVDYKLLYEIAYEQQRIADDIVDLELEHINRILNKLVNDPEPYAVKRTEIELWTKVAEVAKAGRRTGCGFTALGDMLAALGLKYDSKEGKEVIAKVMKTKATGELDCTIDLAILRGTFEGWDKDKEFDLIESNELVGNNSFYNFIAEEFSEHADKMYKYGRRNISWSTVAPTGTVSLMTQTTSGIEPLFSPYYFRKKKINPNDKEARVDFTDDLGDKWQEYPVMHPKFKLWHEITGDPTMNLEECDKQTLDNYFELSPWCNSTANDIDWVERVDIQSIVQKYTTHSISSTINLPNNVSKEDVSKIYMAAYEKGLKGVTVYRDGSRTGVISTESTKGNQGFEQHNSPKRTKELKGTMHKTTVKGVEYLVAIGFMEGHPYEVFAVKNEVAVKDNHIPCIITKVKKGRYDIKAEDLEIVEFTKAMSPDEEDLTRMISTSLRHGAKIDFVVDQLNKSKGSLVDFSKAIARMLLRHVSIKDEGGCPECKTGKLRMEEGCTKCSECHYSRC